MLELLAASKHEAAAMRALRSVMRAPAPSKPKRARAKAGGLRPGGLRPGGGRGRGRGLRPGGKESDPGTSTSSEQSEPSETDIYWRDIVKSVGGAGSGRGGRGGGREGGRGGGLGALPGSMRSIRCDAKQWVANGCPPWAVASSPSRRTLPREPGTYMNIRYSCARRQLGMGKGCHKTRGLFPASTARHAELEPLAFLHDWRDLHVPPDKIHRHLTPTKHRHRCADGSAHCCVCGLEREGSCLTGFWPWFVVDQMQGARPLALVSALPWSPSVWGLAVVAGGRRGRGCMSRKK